MIIKKLKTPNDYPDLFGGWKIDGIGEEEVCFNNGAFVKESKTKGWILVDGIQFPCNFYIGFKSKEKAVAIAIMMCGEILETSKFKKKFNV